MVTRLAIVAKWLTKLVLLHLQKGRSGIDQIGSVDQIGLTGLVTITSNMVNYDQIGLDQMGPPYWAYCG